MLPYVIQNGDIFRQRSLYRLHFFSLLFLRSGSIIAIVNNIYQDSQIDAITIQDVITNSSNTFFQETSYSGRFPLSTFHIWFWRPVPELIKSSCRDSYPLFPSSRPVCAGPFTVWSRHYKLQELCWTGWMPVFGSLRSFPLLNHILQRWNCSSPPHCSAINATFNEKGSRKTCKILVFLPAACPSGTRAVGSSCVQWVCVS